MKFSSLSFFKVISQKKCATLFHESSIVHTLVQFDCTYVSSVILVCLLSHMISYQIRLKIRHQCLFGGQLTMNPLRSNVFARECFEASSIKHH